MFQRTATPDTELGGVEIMAGQRVGLFYGSANFDEDVCEDQFVFDILRNPNPHLSFGGAGAHSCIGANLARMELQLMLDAIADVIPDIEKVAEPERAGSMESRVSVGATTVTPHRYGLLRAAGPSLDPLSRYAETRLAQPWH